MHFVKDNVERIQMCLQALKEALQEIANVAQGHGKKLESFFKEVEEIERRLKDEKVVIAFLGEYNAGKSSLINALFELKGENALPVGSTPTTDRVYHVQYGQTRERIERGAEVDLFLPEPRLIGFKVLDVPGTNSTYEEHTKKAKDTISKSDFVVFVSNVSQPFSASQMEFIKDIQRKRVKILAYVVNWADVKNDKEKKEISQYVGTELNNLKLGDTQVFLTSVKSGENLKDLKEYIFSNSEKLMKEKLQALRNRIYVLRDRLMKDSEDIISEYEKELQKYQQIKRALENSVREIESRKEEVQRDISRTLRLLAENTILKVKSTPKFSILFWRSSDKEKALENLIKDDAERSEQHIKEKLEGLKRDYTRIVSELGKFLELSRVRGDILWEFSGLSHKVVSRYEEVSREAGQRVLKSIAMGAVSTGGVGSAVLSGLSAWGKITLFEPTTALFVGIPLMLVGGLLGGIFSSAKAKKQAEEKLKKYYEELERQYTQAIEEYAQSIRNEIEKVSGKLRDPRQDLQKLKAVHSRLKGELSC